MINLPIEVFESVFCETLSKMLSEKLIVEDSTENNSKSNYSISVGITNSQRGVIIINLSYSTGFMLVKKFFGKDDCSYNEMMKQLYSLFNDFIKEYTEMIGLTVVTGDDVSFSPPIVTDGEILGLRVTAFDNENVIVNEKKMKICTSLGCIVVSISTCQDKPKELLDPNDLSMYLDSFSEGSKTVLRDYGINVFDNDESSVQNSLDATKEENYHISVVIGIIGQIRGNVVLKFSKQMAYQLVTSMAGMSEEDPGFDTMINDCATELTNMISGRGSARIADNGVLVEITPPTIISGNQNTIIGLNGVVFVELQTDIGEMEINFSLEN